MTNRRDLRLKVPVTTKRASPASRGDDRLSFAYSATLRIFGDIPDLEDISAHLGLEATYTHQKHDKPRPASKEFGHDMWSYSPVLHESEPLERHIDELWKKLRPHKEYLLGLRKSVTVDVFLSYRSNCDHCGVEVPHTSLEMFLELKIPFGLSIIVV
jgi:Domain of unknown function (DUF4279)